jgi:RNA polymerase sigma factor (sigma-70 family)
MPDDDRQRFSALFDEHYRGVLAYAARRTDPETAKEVASETFLVAWRRLQDVPGHPLPWLLVVARNTLANRHRSEYRRIATESEAAWLSRVRRDDVPLADGVSERLATLAGLAALSANDRETLLLVAWDGLTPREAAQVAGCSTATFHVRLHRARGRLTALLEAADSHDSAARADEPHRPAAVPATRFPSATTTTSSTTISTTARPRTASTEETP